MAYVGNIKDRVELVVTLVGDYTFTSYYGFTETLNHIYTMKDDNGNIFVWKTSGYFMIETYKNDELVDMIFANKHDKIRIKGTIKDHSEYKGEPQTVLTRCKLVEIVEKALTKEEKQELKRKEQLDSLKSGDFIYNMPYSQYKNHYSDCETLAGSYDPDTSYIDVIVRDGRLKKSGVRGQHFSDYLFRCDNKCRCIYAVSEENAWKRLEKEFPNTDDWALVEVTPSGRRNWF